MYKKILIAYDGSEKSQKALDHAADMADYHHALLIIIHIMKEKPAVSSQALYPTPPVSRAGDDARMNVSVQERKDEEINLQSGKGKFLVRKARNRLYLEDDQIETEVLFGDPAKEIVRFANAAHVDLIVVGNRGLNGIRKMMLGSVSEKVAQFAECPVLIIK